MGSLSRKARKRGAACSSTEPTGGGQVSACPDCGLPKANLNQNTRSPGVCASYRHKGRIDCQVRTIARMRPVVEAATRWFHAGDSSDDLDGIAATLRLVDSLEAGGFIPKPTPEEAPK